MSLAEVYGAVPYIVTKCAQDMTPNAGRQARPIAGATQERRLLGVGSTAKLGAPASDVRIKRARHGTLVPVILYVAPLSVPQDDGQGNC